MDTKARKKFRENSGRFVAKKLPGNVAGSSPAAEIAFGVKAFFVPAQTLPADDSPQICRRNERIVMIHFAVAFLTAGRRSVGNLRVD